MTQELLLIFVPGARCLELSGSESSNSVSKAFLRYLHRLPQLFSCGIDSEAFVA